MYKLMINDNFIMNITTFNEILNREGELKLSFYEELEESDIPNAEQSLLAMQPYAQEGIISNVKILNSTEQVMFETNHFTTMDSATITFSESGTLSLHLELI